MVIYFLSSIAQQTENSDPRRNSVIQSRLAESIVRTLPNANRPPNPPALYF